MMRIHNYYKKTMLYFFLVLFFYFQGLAQNEVHIPFTKDKSSSLMHIEMTLNNVVRRQFIFDTGASGISVNSTIGRTLKSMNQYDYKGDANVTIANGSVVKAEMIKLRSVTIGGYELKNIEACVMPDPQAPLLIGQSVFDRLGNYTIDNQKGEIIFTPNNNSNNRKIANRIPASSRNVSLSELRFVPCRTNVVSRTGEIVLNSEI